MPISPHMTPEVAELIRAGGAPWLTPRTNDRLIKEKSKKECSTEEQHQRGERMDTCVRDREGQQEKFAESEQHYGDTAQCREDCPTASTDRSPAARPRCRADRASMAVGSGLKTLTPDEVALIQCELQDKSQKIQDGLSKLSSDPKYSGSKKSSEMKRARIKSSGKWVGKRVDLLEIYCDEESELTKVCNMKGGRALRFTKEDGDLTTNSGRQKTVDMD